MQDLFQTQFMTCNSRDSPLAGTVPAWFHGVYGTPCWNSPPFRAAFRHRSSGVPALPERFRRFLLERRRNAGLFQRAFRLRSGPVPVDIPWTSQIARLFACRVLDGTE